MKRILLFVLVILLLFFVSAATSFMMGFGKPKAKPLETVKEEAPAPEPEKLDLKQSAKKADGSTPNLAPSGSQAGKEIPVALRPPYVSGTEESAQLATLLRDRLNAVRERENTFNFREQSLQMIDEDIKQQQKSIDELRSQVELSMKDVNDFFDRQQRLFDDQRFSIKKREEKLNMAMTDLSNQEGPNLKKMAEVYNNMDPNSAALVFQQLNKSGHVDTVVKLLAFMKERSSARVLNEMTTIDKELAANLTERLKGVRQPSAVPPTKGTSGPISTGANPAAAAPTEATPAEAK